METFSIIPDAETHCLTFKYWRQIQCKLNAWYWHTVCTWSGLCERLERDHCGVFLVHCWDRSVFRLASISRSVQLLANQDQKRSWTTKETRSAYHQEICRRQSRHYYKGAILIDLHDILICLALRGDLTWLPLETIRNDFAGLVKFDTSHCVKIYWIWSDLGSRQLILISMDFYWSLLTAEWSLVDIDLYWFLLISVAYWLQWSRT